MRLASFKADLDNILRDRMLAVLPFVPFLAALGFRFIVPFATRLLTPVFDLVPYHAYFGIFFLLIGPVMAGFVAGFLFLDEAEAGTLLSLAVSPPGVERLAAARLGAAAAYSFAASLAAWPLHGLASPPLPALVAAAALAAATGPAIAFFILAFARNKVEGLTIGKLAGMVLLAPLAFAFARAPLSWLAAPLPAWWVGAVYLGEAATGVPPAAAVAGGVAAAAVWTAGFGFLARRKALGG